MRNKTTKQIAKDTFQDYLLGLKTSFKVLDYETYCKTNFYLRINKYTSKVEVVSNHPFLGGSSYANIDIDYYSYQLPKLEFTERDFECREFLSFSEEEKSYAVLLGNNQEYADIIGTYKNSDQFIDDIFFSYLLEVGTSFLIIFEDVVELLKKRVEIPRNLQFAEFARKFDMRIQRKLFA